MSTLSETKTDIYDNQLKGRLHWVTKPLRSVLRAAVVGVVLLTVSPVGVLFNIMAMVGRSGEYTFRRFVLRQDISNEVVAATAEKVKAHGKAIFTDLYCTAAGVVANGLLLLFTASGLGAGLLVSTGSLTVAEGVLGVAGSIFGAGFAGYALGMFNLSKALSLLLADRNLRSGMYLALEMRNQLGMVDENGGLLRYSLEDQVTFVEKPCGKSIKVEFMGKPITEMPRLIQQAEMDLLDLVIEANKLLKNNRLNPINFSYPFDGDMVAKEVQAILKKSDQKTSAYGLGVYDVNIAKTNSLIKDLKKMQYKIKTLKECFNQIPQLTYEESVLMMWFKKQRSLQRYELDSYVNYLDYKAYFDFKSAQRTEEPKPSVTLSIDLNHFYKSVDAVITPLDPNNAIIIAEDSPYDRFLQTVRVNKWRAENGVGPLTPLHELIGLNDQSGHAERQKAFRKYSLIMHPDKNPSRGTEAEALYKIVAQLKA